LDTEGTQESLGETNTLVPMFTFMPTSAAAAVAAAASLGHSPAAVLHSNSKNPLGRGRDGDGDSEERSLESEDPKKTLIGELKSEENKRGRIRNHTD
jgi:hypothetical protein